MCVELECQGQNMSWNRTRRQKGNKQNQTQCIIFKGFETSTTLLTMESLEIDVSQIYYMAVFLELAT